MGSMVNRRITASELTLVNAALAYKRTRTVSVAALKQGIAPTQDGQRKQLELESHTCSALEALRMAAIELPDDQPGRKKRVGDVWENPRGTHYTIVRFNERGEAIVVGGPAGGGTITGPMTQENRWTLVREGTGEEEPS